MPKLSKARPTFGLEIEFLVPWKVDNSLQQPVVENGIVRVPVGGGTRHLQEAVARSEVHDGIRASIVAVGNKAGTVAVTDDAPGIALQLWSDNWIVKRDISVHEDNLEEYDGFIDVEINTPIYNAPPDGDKDAQKWKRVTRTMLKIQKDWPNILINKTCAYQVHVGLPTMYSLLDVKRLATILWLAETRLLELYSPHRREESGWYKPLSKQSRLARAHTVDEDLNPNHGERHSQPGLNKQGQKNHHVGNYHTGTSIDDFEKWIGKGTFGDRVLEDYAIESLNLQNEATSSTLTYKKPKLEDKMIDLWKAEDGDQISYMLAPKMTPGTGSRLAYNFNNVFGTKGTVEFRQMESTVDPVHLQNWAIVCYKFVLFAKDCDTQKFKRLLTCLLNDVEQYSTWDLLKDLKCQVTVIDWFKKKNVESR